MGCANSKKINRQSNSAGFGENNLAKNSSNMCIDLQSDNSSEKSSIVPHDALSEMLKSEQSSLSEIARPLLESRISCEVQTMEELLKQIEASRENQRLARRHMRKKAKLEAIAHQKWMMYNSLDLYDEAELRMLASFMDIVIEHVTKLSVLTKQQSFLELERPDDEEAESPCKSPKTDSSNQFNQVILERCNSMERLLERKHSRRMSGTKLKSIHEGMLKSNSFDDMNNGQEIPGPLNVIKMKREQSLENILCIDTLQVSDVPIPADTAKDHELPPGFITISAVAQMIEIFRHGGKLSKKAVQKILRLSYKNLKALPNTVHVSVDQAEMLTVVGDLHGQLEDLLHILDESGLPGPDHKYIFNGDFVDRGSQSVEVVCILLALFAATPNHVVLNRGNHEDYAVCCVYGFQRECLDKYDEVIFGMFIEVFQYLPLFTIVNSAILVLHGGLFSDENVVLSELNEIERHKFSLGDFHDSEEFEDPLYCMSIGRDRRELFLKLLQRDALWSDPQAAIQGTGASSRGAGVEFGADVTRKFLERNGLQTIVRSHECIKSGFTRPFPGDDASLLCTLFSASNYGGAGNAGAYMKFSTEQGYGSTPVECTQLFYTVHYYDYAPAAQKSADEDTNLSLREVILKKRPALLLAFEAADPQKSGFVSRKVWTEVMQRVSRLKLNWYMMLNILVPPECAYELGIEYLKFLTKFPAHMEGSNEMMSVDLVDVLYSQHLTLESVFYFFDNEGTGVITRENMREGCDLLNRSLPAGKQLRELDRIIELIDIDETGIIDMNEFFEVNRLLEEHRRTTADLSSPLSPNPMKPRRPSYSESYYKRGTSGKVQDGSFIGSHNSLRGTSSSESRSPEIVSHVTSNDSMVSFEADLRLIST